jgi:hypothetical protein
MIEGSGKRSLRRPKLSTKGSSAPGRREVIVCVGILIVFIENVHGFNI